MQRSDNTRKCALMFQDIESETRRDPRWYFNPAEDVESDGSIFLRI
jgi:hypothetical protein